MCGVPQKRVWPVRPGPELRDEGGDGKTGAALGYSNATGRPIITPAHRFCPNRFVKKVPRSNQDFGIFRRVSATFRPLHITPRLSGLDAEGIMVAV